MKTNYQVTIGYRAIVTVDLATETEDEANKIAYDLFDKATGKMVDRKIQIIQEKIEVAGIVNMDKTFHSI
jgi:hypothetical protein